MADKKEFILKVIEIQKCLNAPKNKRNDYGGYNYRTAEGILESVKPLLIEKGLLLTLSDATEECGTFEQVNKDMAKISGSRVYVTAKATLTDGEYSIEVTGKARESLTQKGMNDPQMTGSSSSYARKYALNGLFCIDDSDGDPDAGNEQSIRSELESKALKWINNSNWPDAKKKAVISGIKRQPDDYLTRIANGQIK